jgi:hypothetical protein
MEGKSTTVIEFLKKCDDEKLDGLALLESKNIKVARYPDRNLYILNYEQIEKNPIEFTKTHIINRECRNLVIRSNPWRVLSRSFKRFFNYGEDQSETKIFDEMMAKGLVTATTKYDGSLITVAYFDDQWNIFTRGSLADENTFRGTELFPDKSDTFGKHVRKYVDLSKLDKTITYVFELCTPNAHVTKYEEEFLVLLSANRDGQEIPIDSTKTDLSKFRKSETFTPRSIQDIYEKFKSMPPDFEGYVLSCFLKSCTLDSTEILRMKVKQASYVELHHKVTKTYNFADLVNIVMNGEIAEVIAYVPQHRDILSKIERILREIELDLAKFYEDNRDLTQKDYAKLVGKLSFSWLLFDLKNGKAASVIDGLFDEKNRSKVSAELGKIITKKPDV